MRRIGSIGDFRTSPIVSYALTWPIDTCGSTNDAVVDAMHDVRVGHEVEAAARAHAVDRGDHGLAHAAVPGGELERRRRGCGGTARAARPCPSASCRTSRPVWKASPLPVFTITRTAGSASSSAHACSSSAEHRGVHGVADLGPVEDQPPDAVAHRHVERLVAAVGS